MVIGLAGNNSFLLRAELSKLTSEFLAEHGDIALERLDGEEASYERIAEAVQSLPFLASRKMAVLLGPSANKQFVENAETLLADIPETTDVVIVEPKVDKRTAYYKWLKNHTEFKEFVEPDERSLAAWVVGYAKELGATISNADANYLISRIGVNQQRLSNEIQKLALNGTNITRAVVDEMTEATPQSKIFDLLDAAFNGQSKRALELYHEQRSMKVEPQEIIGMLGWQLRQVALAKTAGKHDLVREGKVSPYSANKAQRIASRLTLAELRTLVHDLVVIDARSKREPINLDEALQNYILHLAA